MRKLLTATLGVAFMLMISVSAFAQKGDMKLGVLAGYGTEIKSPGFGAKFHYGLTDEIRLAPGFIYFLPKTELGVKSTIWNLDLDGNYIFSDNGDMGFHGVAGLNITGWSFSYDEELAGYDYSASSTKIGINVGAGMNYSFSDKMHLLLEAKYVLSDFDQLVISAGLMFNL